MSASSTSAGCCSAFATRFQCFFTLPSAPILYGKKTEGVIRSTVWIGPDGKVKKHWKRVAKAEQHPADVLEALAGTA